MWRVTALVGLLLVTACRIGTDLPGEDSATLELAEAEGITAALVRAVLEPTVFSGQQLAFSHTHGPSGSHTHPIGGPYVHDGDLRDRPLPSHHNLFNVELSEEVPCAVEGVLLLEAAAVGEGDPLTGPGRVDYEIGQDATDCVLVLTEAGDQRMALESPPYVTGQTHVEFDGASSAAISGALGGGIAWEGEAKAGECELELAFEATGDAVLAITDVPVTGSFCDLTIDMTVTFER